MKRYGMMMLSFGLILAALPAVPALIRRYSGEPVSENTEETSQSTESTLYPENTETIRMLDTSTGDVLTLSMEDYIVGAVTAEMPASFEEEAIKAQAVAIHTYAVRRQMAERENPSADLCGADISNDPDRYQAYFTKSQAMEFYGSGYDSAREKITAAVHEVLPYIILYEDKPILAAFCSISSGQTESAENVWGEKVPYLVSADSEADRFAPNYLQSTDFTADELKELLKKSYPEGDFSSPAKDWLTVEKRSDSGTVLTAKAGGIMTTGQEIRQALGLRSASFEVKWTGDVCSVTTKGYGHGVGMSQYGADAMADAGADWREILLHYYNGAEIGTADMKDLS
ncbi:MAG: stage II sporulation protein D [Ruminococcus sp.]